MLPIYEKFVRSLLGALQAGKDNAPDDVNPQLVAAFNDFSRDLVVWGSDEIVTAWSKYLRGWAGEKTEQEKAAMTFALEDLLTAIRKECGHKGPLAHGNLLKLFINDLDEYLASQGLAALP